MYSWGNFSGEVFQGVVVPKTLRMDKAKVFSKWWMESAICSGLSILLRNAKTQNQPANLPSLNRVALLFELDLNVLTT